MACIKKTPTGLWQVDYRIGSLRKRVSFGTKREAEEFIKELNLRPLDQVTGYKAIKSLAVRDVVEQYKATVSALKSPWTQTLETKIFNEFVQTFGTMSLMEITFQHMEFYQATLRKRLKPQTVNRNFTLLKHFFKRCVEWHYIAKSPAENLRHLKNDQEKVIRTYSAIEVDAMIKSAQPWLSDVIFLISRVAMRRKEVVSLRWSSVDLRLRVFHVESHEDFHPKGYRPRTIPMTDELFEFFQKKRREALKLGKIQPGDHVFLNSQGGKIHPNCVTKEFLRLGQKLGLPQLGPHQLRHTCLTNMVKVDSNLEKVRLIAGHADTRVTQRYLHLVPTDLIDTLQKVSDEQRKKTK